MFLGTHHGCIALVIRKIVLLHKSSYGTIGLIIKAINIRFERVWEKVK